MARHGMTSPLPSTHPPFSLFLSFLGNSGSVEAQERATTTTITHRIAPWNVHPDSWTRVGSGHVGADYYPRDAGPANQRRRGGSQVGADYPNTHETQHRLVKSALTTLTLTRCSTD